jgi:hypothetical protein
MWILLPCDQQGRELQHLPLEGAPLTVGCGEDRDLVLDSKAVCANAQGFRSQGAGVR